jgi:HAD superfamily hydrolase (TIGR01509 family)
MIRAILWDNDGVLVDSEPYYFEANRVYLRRFGIELSAEDYFQWYLCENRGAWHLLDENASTEQIAYWRRERNALHLELLKRAGSLLIPGVENVLEHLNGRVDMGIVTSATRASFEAIHNRHDILRHFRFALTAETYDKSKPSPEPYLLGLDKLGCRAEECLVIEDSPRGLQAALAAGIRCIILRNPLSRHHDFADAYRIVGSMDELLVEIEALLD